MTKEEAIEKVREMKLSPEKDAELIIALHTLIPELRESEDERIRKMCITAVNIAASAGGGLLHHEATQCLDWLEKQKEQKPSWSEEDIKKIERLRSVVNQLASYTDSLDVNGDYCAGDYAELDAWLKSLPLKRKIDGFTVEEFNAISRAIEILYGSHFAIVPPLKDILTKMAKYDRETT